MVIQRFEEIVAWQKAKELTLEIYRSFQCNRDYGFRDQILRCSVSIMNNIAEGFERTGEKEFAHFLFIAKGSCGELRSMLYLAIELRYISKEKFEYYYRLSIEISKLIYGLIRSLGQWQGTRN